MPSDKDVETAAQHAWKERKLKESVERDDTSAGTYGRKIACPNDSEDYKERTGTGGFALTTEEYKLWKKWSKEAKDAKFPKGALLDEWLQARIAIHRINSIEGTMTQKAFLADKDWVTARQRAHDRVTKAEEKLQGYAKEQKEKRDAIELLDEYRGKARDFVRKHAGEFTVLAQLKCPKCKTQVKEVVHTSGMPWWAARWEKDAKGEITYLAWSPEVLWLYEQGHITLAQAAFILRTSPRGLIYTAKRRGETMKASDMGEAEAEVQQLRKASEWPQAMQHLA